MVPRTGKTWVPPKIGFQWAGAPDGIGARGNLVNIDPGSWNVELPPTPGESPSSLRSRREYEASAAGIQALRDYQAGLRGPGRANRSGLRSQALDTFNPPWDGVRKYGIIYADPPWAFSHRSSRGGTEAKKKGDSASKTVYPTMTQGDMRQLPVAPLAADHAFLVMWTTSRHLQVALDLFPAWGFEYRQIFHIWGKLTSEGQARRGTGTLTRGNAEILLLGVRGQAMKLAPSGTGRRAVSNLLLTQPHVVQGHSRKPPGVRNTLVDILGDWPRIELFGRDTTWGWDTWGNEVGKFFGGRKTIAFAPKRANGLSDPEWKTLQDTQYRTAVGILEGFPEEEEVDGVSSEGGEEEGEEDEEGVPPRKKPRVSGS